MTKLLSLLALALLLSGCNGSTLDKTISLTAKKEQFVSTIPIKGELRAAKATPISAPAGIFEPQTIAWLAEENTLIKKGDVVARFDTTKYIHQSEQAQLTIDQVEVSYVTKEKTLNNEKEEIATTMKLITDELILVERFSPEGIEAFSKNEIIDSARNMQYLKARKKHTDWRNKAHEKKSISELSLLDLERQKHTSKLAKYHNAIDKTEVKAPHDGLFVLQKDRHGMKPRVGGSVWPGRKIGSLPEMHELLAKIYILESEAAGLTIGQAVSFSLDAYPEEVIQGALTQIDAIAKAAERESPIKYFGATVAITSNSQNYWHSGLQLRGRVFVTKKDNVISVPSQAIFHDKEIPYVYLNDGRKWSKRKVVTGPNNHAVTEIIAGIDEGDVIALHEPKRW
ncbi:MAG: HlyD family efflux transporter periplasmic adaptor subunit [Gammaproteobacteria bacterium]|nr:HlyD family efflux transporter periplasmic adaptor subunit [Gammaproteobacteria bacterium]